MLLASSASSNGSRTGGTDFDCDCNFDGDGDSCYAICLMVSLRLIHDNTLSSDLVLGGGECKIVELLPADFLRGEDYAEFLPY